MIDTFAIRCNVLKLAFSGQLSQHEVEDGAIDDLLKRVNPNREIKQAEAGPYEIPENWAWVKLEDLYEINPKVEAADDTDAAFIPMERISAGFSELFTFEVEKWSAASKNHTRFADGDVAFAKISPCFENRKSFIATGMPNGIGGGTTELIILRQKEMLPRFTYYVMLDQRFIHDGVASYKGTVGQQRVKADVIKNYMVAVPPKEEQRRIVERIENIFSFLDTIDTLQSQYQDNLATLKSKIIDAGIQGKLTEQLPEDGTAEDLYQQIQQEKLALEKAGKVKKSKPLPPISEEEKPFDIPDNWKWVRLDSIASVISKGTTPRGGKVSYCENGIGFLRAENLKGFDKLNLCNLNYIDENVHIGFLKRSILEDGDILISIAGTLGRTGLVRKADLPLNANQAIAFIRPVNKDRLDLSYVIYSLNAKAIQKMMDYKKVEMAIPNLSLAVISNTIIPLPPLAEQKRIVAKLEELLPLCER